MAIEITFAGLTSEQEKQVTNLTQQIEALNGKLAEIQTERANFEAGKSQVETAIRDKKNAIIIQLREIRAVEIK